MSIRVYCRLLLTVFFKKKAEFRCQFPYLGKLQDIGFIPRVESQSDYRKFNIQCLVFNHRQQLKVKRRQCFKA